MSFTQDVKLETSLLKAEGDEARAELSALIQLTSSLSITHEGMTLLVQTENAPVSRCVYRLLRERFAEVRIEPMVLLMSLAALLPIESLPERSSVFRASSRWCGAR